MIYVLMFLIHFTATLTFATRIVAVRTKMLALTLSMFNFITFFYRTVNGFQVPFLAKYIETNLNSNHTWDPYLTFVWLMFLASIASVAGLLCIPTAQRLVTKTVEVYSARKSFTYLMKGVFRKRNMKALSSCFSWPGKKHLTQLLVLGDLPWKLLFINMITTSFLTVGILSAIYAGYLNPGYRTTASTLSFVINGIAAILLYVFVDPPLGLLTDRAIQGSVGEPYFRRVIVWFGITRVAGTIFAQLIFIPIAHLVALLATEM
jgi:hypothetical protein